MASNTEALYAAVEEIFETDVPIRSGEPALHTYYGDLREAALFERFVRYHEGIIRFADFDPQGKKVLEVGSGFGLVLVWLASHGADTYGVEIVPWMVEDVHSYLRHLPIDIASRITVRHGSASRIDYDDSSFDLVLSIEALSHYLEYELFLAEAHRVLKPEGRLVVVDGNNGLNPAIRRHCKHIWALHERDLNDGDDPWLFIPKRERIIQESFPELQPADAHTLALRTAGMVRSEIVEAARDYLDTGRLPESVSGPGQLTVHPEHEMVMERLFNPYALAREIRSLGFKVKTRGYWGGAGGSRLLTTTNGIVATLSPLTMVTARSFRICAVKRSDSGAGTAAPRA